MPDPLTEPAPPGPDSTSPPADATADTPAPRLAGGYEIGAEIARGGMGVVHRGRDVALNREVAIKLLQDKFPADGPTARRFIEEARITGQLQHPGIPAVHHVGTLLDGRPFLAMKLIKGRTLDALLKSSGGEEPRRSFLGVFEAICQAVGYAHAHGVVHRDLKPANVMVGAFGEVQVMDWGLAKVLTSGGVDPRRSTPDDDITLGTEIRSLRDAADATHAGSVMGTPAFMPPEQAIGAIDQIDARTDVFGLGAILCVLLTGRPPYVSASAESTRQLAARAKLDEAFAALDSASAEPELVALCKRCLSAEKADRPADGNAVAKEVAQLRAAADERARQAEVERERQTVRADEERTRRRVLAWAGAIVAAALTTGIVGTAIGLVRANAAAVREKERADGEAAAKEAAERADGKKWDVLEAMVSGVTEDSLTTQPAIGPEQKKFLENAIGYYREVAAETGTDERFRARAAAAAYRVGRIESRLGRREQAVAAFTRSRDEYAALAVEFPAVPAFRSGLAQSHNNLGVQLAESGKWSAAAAAFRAALDVNAKLAADHPADPAHRSEWAMSHTNLGYLLLHSLADRPAAEATYRAGLAIDEKLAADFPDVPAYRRGLAASHTNLGALLAGLGRRPEAEAAYRAGLALFEGLAADFPDDPTYRVSLGAVYCNLGGLAQGAGRPADSLDWFAKAIRTLAPVRERQPGAVTPRQFLCNSHWNRALALMALRRHADAVADWDQALALDDGTRRAEIQEERSLCLRHATLEPAPPPRGGR